MTVSKSVRLQQRGVAVIDLVHGDPVLAKHVRQAYVSENDPPLFFDWNDANLAVFWTRAVDYGVVEGADPPPAEINGGAHLTGEPTDDNIKALKLWILRYVASAVNIRRLIGGPTRTLGFRCSSAGQACAIKFLAVSGHSTPWLVGVAQYGNPLPGPLATVYRPHTDSPDIRSGLELLSRSPLQRFLCPCTWKHGEELGTRESVVTIHISFCSSSAWPT
jgi:hypothetical protein